MKIENISLTALDLGANAESEPFYIGHAAMYAIQITNTGTAPTGTFKLQASCDVGQPNAATREQQSNGVTNWTDIASASSAITATGTVLFNVADPAYFWVRIVYTYTSGDGSAAIRVCSKGI